MKKKLLYLGLLFIFVGIGNLIVNLVFGATVETLRGFWGLYRGEPSFIAFSAGLLVLGLVICIISIVSKRKD